MTVSDQIIQVLNALCAKFGIVIDWTSETVIPYISTLCEKLITYEIWTSIAWIAVVSVLSIIGIILVIVFRDWFREGFEDKDFGATMSTALIVALWIVSFITIGVQIFDIIKCTTFPEMYVFEFIQNMIKSGS